MITIAVIIVPLPKEANRYKAASLMGSLLLRQDVLIAAHLGTAHLDLTVLKEQTLQSVQSNWSAAYSTEQRAREDRVSHAKFFQNRFKVTLVDGM